MAAAVILELAESSKLIYQEWDIVAKQLTRQGISDFCFFDKPDGTQAMLYRKDGLAYLIFRGTQQVKDWLTNADILCVSCDFARHYTPRGRVHRGFLHAYLQLQAAIQAELKAWRFPPLLIAGHSLGGALATIATIDLTFQGREILFTCTFGQPRVFNRALSKAISKKIKIYRFVNRWDIVPRLPSALRFRHFRKILLLTQTDVTLICPSLRWILFILLGYLILLFKPGAQSIADHAIALYCDRLQRYQKQLEKLLPYA